MPEPPPPPAPAQADDARAALVEKLRTTADRLGTSSLSMAAFCREARVTTDRIYRHYGSWHGLCEAAGLAPTAWKTRVPEDEIFAAMRDCFLAHGAIVGRTLFERGFAYSRNLVTRRFGSWKRALDAFHDWVLVADPAFPHLEALDAARAESRGPRPQNRDGDASAPSAASQSPPWPARGGPVAGELLGFRALLFAPVNELGVVCAFAIAARDLGYAIETVSPAFPDCTARRRVRGGRWESVRIEFEFRSRNFRDHGHDAQGCDVIVCWEHDWPDCPLEVLELKSAVARLAGQAP